MKIEDIIKIYKDRRGKSIKDFSKSSVVIPIVEKDGQPQVLLEVRSFNMKKQPGDICFPGGKVEKGETYKEAAARELKEELNIKEDDFEIIGEGDYYITPYGSIIYAYIAAMEDKNINPRQEEVDHVFYVPLKFLMENEPQCHKMKISPKVEENFPFHLIRGGRSYQFLSAEYNQYFYSYNGYNIWGITAIILKGFIDVLKNNKS